MPNTKEQQLAIDTINRNVSVSAGAGSGKTAVLKQRFLHILEESKNAFYGESASLEGDYGVGTQVGDYGGVKASNIVCITFTRKAAGEIKSRIREAMLEAMNNGDQLFWRKQLEELEKAQINTIHGLCSRILRENPVEANLDPAFVVSEDIDYVAFKEDCIRAFLRRELLADGENAVKVLTSILGTNTLHGQLSSLTKDFEDIAAERDLAFPYRVSAALLPQRIAALKAKVEWLVGNRAELVKKTTKAYQALEAMGSDLPVIFEQLDAEPCDLSLVDMHLAMRPSGNLTAEIYEARDLSAEIKACLVDVKAIPLMEHWQDLITGLSAYINEQKEKENILTYDDLETKAIELLENNDDVRTKYHKKFQYIMVDEFQDTNDKQCALIYLLCGDSKTRLEGNKLFVVGDRKQSIYRFRGADVDVFKDVEERIKAKKGENISMKTNFRSKDKILACCNETFAKIMGVQGNAVDFEPLDCADFNQDYPVLPELVTIDPNDADARTAEVYAVAQKIKSLGEAELNSPNHVPGSKVYGNMAILLRSMTRVNDLAQVLAEYSIPYVVIDGKGFYERQEICDIINILDVVNNPYQNIPLAACLKSPFFAFDDELLAKIALKEDYLWDALHSIDMEFVQGLRKSQVLQLSSALDKIITLKSSLPYLDADAAWNKLWQIFDIDAVIAVQKSGKQKLANVKKLRKLSLEYCHEKGVGLADWLDYVKDAKVLGMEETNANLEATDAVQIMTIHKSKGLEFKQVFIPFLGAKGHTDSRTIVYGKGVGLGIQLLNDKGENIKTSVFDDIKADEKEKDREERQRILYVAMTRAEEELYMFGIPAKDVKSFDEANWMDQLCLIYDGYDGVTKTVFSSVDIVLPESESQEETIDVSDELKTYLEPLPSFSESGRKLFTASALNHYLYCQRQYFYKEFMGLPGLNEEVVNAGNGISAATMGSIIHEALEKYTGKETLETAFKAAVKHWAPGANTTKAWQILLGYVQSELYKSIPKEQLREKDFYLEARDFILNGFIDVLAFNDDGTMSIIDYKTGEPPEEGDEELGYMYQLAIYKYAAEKIYGKKVVKAELHFLQNNTVFALEKADAFDEAMALAKEIAAKSKEEEFACNLESCKHCSYCYLCKQK